MLVTVARFRDPWEAQMLRGRLEAEDIPAFVVHQYHIGTVWYLSRALHGVKVEVLGEDVADALEVLARIQSGKYASELLDLFGDLGEPQCPHCGSISCKRRGTASQFVFAFLAGYLFGVLIPPSIWYRTCRVCGTRWVE